MHVKMLQQPIRLAQWSDVSHRTAVQGAMRDCFLFYDFPFSYVVVFLLFWLKNIFLMNVAIPFAVLFHLVSLLYCKMLINLNGIQI